MAFFDRKRRLREERAAGELFALRVALDALFEVGAAGPIEAMLASRQRNGVRALEEAGASESTVDRFVDWMGGFIAAARRGR